MWEFLRKGKFHEKRRLPPWDPVPTYVQPEERQQRRQQRQQH